MTKPNIKYGTRIRVKMDFQNGGDVGKALTVPIKVKENWWVGVHWDEDRTPGFIRLTEIDAYTMADIRAEQKARYGRIVKLVRES